MVKIIGLDYTTHSQYFPNQSWVTSQRLICYADTGNASRILALLNFKNGERE